LQRYRLSWISKKRLYIRPKDRFFNLYEKFLGNNFVYLTDSYRSLLDYSIYAPVYSSFFDKKNYELFFYELLGCLSNNGIYLTNKEFSLLQKQSFLVVCSIEKVRRFFSVYSIDGLVLDGDSWLPGNVFSAFADQQNIPVLCLQHGLDCEHWCLDEALSSYYCVWGEERKKRYKERSEFQPREIFVTGNPLYDKFRFPQKVSSGGNRWLLLTRPHTPEKCYESSRYPDEGKDVLRMILKELLSFPDATLVIKPHPRDDTSPYKELVRSLSLLSRVSFASMSRNCLECIQNADIVFSEDSTSGAEAMILEKPVIHVSACKAGPCLPFIDYGAALSGLDSTMLHDSISRLYAGLSPEEKKKMHKGMVEFIKDHCGDLDGRASQRVASVVRNLF